jgi:pimeloyl-ACP methyl ester carboxylesterase
VEVSALGGVRGQLAEDSDGQNSAVPAAGYLMTSMNQLSRAVDCCPVTAIRVGDRTLETRWWGPGPDDAPTLVLLHEGLGCIELWRDVPERLAAATGCGVFAYSRFGYGQSDGAPLPWPVTYMHEEGRHILPQVLAAAGIRRSILIGHSDGGSIAAVYAGATQDPRLRGVVMIAAHFFVETLNLAAIAAIRQEYENGELRARLARYHRDVDMAFHGWSGAWLNPAFRDFNITGQVSGIRVPVLGLQGSDDPYGTEEQLQVLRHYSRVPTETRLIPGARHSPHLEAKEATLAAITEFVAACLRESDT